MQEEQTIIQNKATYGKKSIWMWVLVYVVLAAIIYGGVYYFNRINRGASGSTNNNSQSNQGSLVGVTGVTKEITVTGRDFSFDPSTITVNKGDTVRITFINEGTFPHNFAISVLGVGTKTIQPGQRDVITFTADQVGQYKFMCTVPGHADQGMVGTVVVK